MPRHKFFVTLSDTQGRRLRELAQRRGVLPGELLRLGFLELERQASIEKQKSNWQSVTQPPGQAVADV